MEKNNHKNNNNNRIEKYPERKKIIELKENPEEIPDKYLEGISEEEIKTQKYAWLKRKEWHDPYQWEFTKKLEENWEAIKQEFENLQKDMIHPWPEKNLYVQSNHDESENEGKGWNVFGLYAFGKKHPRNLALCPITTKIASEIPGLSTCAFSLLEPHSKILPHVGYYGYSEAVLRCHLGLFVPDHDSSEKKIFLDVGGIKGGWEEGKVFIFDDTYNHSATNNSDKTRIVLLLDFKPGWPAVKRNDQPPSQTDYLDKITSQFGYTKD